MSNSRRTHLPCPCGKSSDAYSIQDNGWGKCFTCNENFPPEESSSKLKTPDPQVKSKVYKALAPLVEDFRPFRGLSAETIKKYKVDVAGNPEEAGYVAKYPRFDDKRQHVRNKVRYENKHFDFEGQPNTLTMFGQHAFPAGCAKILTVTEGQDDAMAVYEMTGSKYPAVSIDGAASAEKDARDNFDYLNSFEQIVVCFDNDDPGRKASIAFANVFTPGKVKIFNGSEDLLKDANDYLLAKKAGVFTKDWWNAQPYTPDGLKLGSSMWEEIINRPNHFTVMYPFESMNKKTYGMRLSEVVLLTADTGVGKTSIIKEIEYALLSNEDLKEKGYGVGFLHLEETNADTCLGLMSIHDSKPYHLPDTPRDEDDLRRAYDACINSDRVVIWDHFGSNSVDAVLDKVRHMHALGCKYIVLDHLSIVVSDQSGDERKQLDEISTKLKTLCMNLNIALLAVIHTNRSGSIRGSAGPEQMANIVMKLHREKDSADDWRRNITKITVEKNRFCGRTGPGIYLFYNAIKGRLEELTPEEIQRYEEGETVHEAARGW